MWLRQKRFPRRARGTVLDVEKRLRMLWHSAESVRLPQMSLHEKMDFHRCQRLGKTVVNVTFAEICTHLCLSKYYLRARFAHLGNARKCHICI